EDGLDVARVHAEHDRADGIVHGRDVERSRVEEDEVSLLSRGERAYLVAEAVGARALDGGELENIAGREQLGNVPHFGKQVVGVQQAALKRKTSAHLRKHVRRLVGLDVDAETGANAVVERTLYRRYAVPHLHLDRNGERDLAAAVGDQLKLEVAERAGMDIRRVGAEPDARSQLRQKSVGSGRSHADVCGDGHAHVTGHVPLDLGRVDVGELWTCGGERQREQLIGAGEVFVGEPVNVAGVRIVEIFEPGWLFAEVRAVGVHGSHTGSFEPFDGSVRVLWRRRD